MGEEGQFAILTGNLTSAGQMERIDYIKQGIAENYPGLELVTIEPTYDDTEKTFTIAQNLLTTYPNLKAIMSNTSTAIGPIGKAIEDAGLVGEVYACGQSTPNVAKSAIEAGTCISCTLWDTADWAEMCIRLADMLLKGEEVPREGKVDVPGFPNVCWGEDNTRLMLNQTSHEVFAFGRYGGAVVSTQGFAAVPFGGMSPLGKLIQDSGSLLLICDSALKKVLCSWAMCDSSSGTALARYIDKDVNPRWKFEERAVEGMAGKQRIEEERGIRLRRAASRPSDKADRARL